MKPTTIKTNLTHRFNNTVTIANVDITFDEKGEFEVSKEWLEKHEGFLKKIIPDYGIEVIIPLTKEEEEKKKKQEEEKKKQEEIQKQERDKAVALAHEEYFKITGKKLEENIAIEQLNKLLLDAKDDQIRKKQKFSQELASKTVEELKDILKGAGIPEVEWKNLKKLELIKLITDSI